MNDTVRSQLFKRLKTVGATPVWQLKEAPDRSAFFYTCGMAVDMDGAPKAYAPHGTASALDALGNAGQPGNWYGIVTDNGQKTGNPIVQQGGSSDQPERGFYISPTSLQDKFFHPKTNDVRRYVDATRIPYLALPHKHLKATGIRVGDNALVINTHNGKYCYAIYGDAKNKPNLGESSIRVADLLGLPAHRSGGASSGIVYMVFPDSGIGQGTIHSEETIQYCGRRSLEHFAEYRDKSNTFLDAFPEYSKFKSALIQAGYLI